MAEVSSFRGVLDFFDKVGLYDVVLPFLLIFVIVFAILEKTKVFGTEEIEGKRYTRKNLNAIASFVIAFFVIASAQLVDILTEVTSNTVILLMLPVFFLLLVGSFYKEGEGVFLEGGWKIFFMVLMFIGIVLIFLNALGWLDRAWDWVNVGTGGDAVGAIILIVIVVLFIMLIVREPKRSKSEEKLK